MKPVTILIVAATLLAYVLELAVGGQELCQAHGFVPAHASVASALTSLLLHDPASWVHVGGNAGFLLVFGTLVERRIGSLRFLVLYLAAGLGGALLYAVVNADSATPLVGCSGAVFGVLAACAMLRPGTVVFVGVYVLCNIIGLAFPDAVGMHGVAVSAHIGGFVVGYAMTRVVFARKLAEVAS